MNLQNSFGRTSAMGGRNGGEYMNSYNMINEIDDEAEYAYNSRGYNDDDDGPPGLEDVSEIDSPLKPSTSANRTGGANRIPMVHVTGTGGDYSDSSPEVKSSSTQMKDNFNNFLLRQQKQTQDNPNGNQRGSSSSPGQQQSQVNPSPLYGGSGGDQFKSLQQQLMLKQKILDNTKKVQMNNAIKPSNDGSNNAASKVPKNPGSGSQVDSVNDGSNDTRSNNSNNNNNNNNNNNTNSVNDNNGNNFNSQTYGENTLEKVNQIDKKQVINNEGAGKGKGQVLSDYDLSDDNDNEYEQSGSTSDQHKSKSDDKPYSEIDSYIDKVNETIKVSNKMIDSVDELQKGQRLIENQIKQYNELRESKRQRLLKLSENEKQVKKEGSRDGNLEEILNYVNEVINSKKETLKFMKDNELLIKQSNKQSLICQKMCQKLVDFHNIIQFELNKLKHYSKTLPTKEEIDYKEKMEALELQLTQEIEKRNKLESELNKRVIDFQVLFCDAQEAKKIIKEQLFEIKEEKEKVKLQQEDLDRKQKEFRKQVQQQQQAAAAQAAAQKDQKEKEFNDQESKRSDRTFKSQTNLSNIFKHKVAQAKNQHNRDDDFSIYDHHHQKRRSKHETRRPSNSHGRHASGLDSSDLNSNRQHLSPGGIGQAINKPSNETDGEDEDSFLGSGYSRDPVKDAEEETPTPMLAPPPFALKHTNSMDYNQSNNLNSNLNNNFGQQSQFMNQPAHPYAQMQQSQNIMYPQNTVPANPRFQSFSQQQPQQQQLQSQILLPGMKSTNNPTFIEQSQSQMQPLLTLQQQQQLQGVAAGQPISQPTIASQNLSASQVIKAPVLKPIGKSSMKKKATDQDEEQQQQQSQYQQQSIQQQSSVPITLGLFDFNIISEGFSPVQQAQSDRYSVSKSQSYLTSTSGRKNFLQSSPAPFTNTISSAYTRTNPSMLMQSQSQQNPLKSMISSIQNNQQTLIREMQGLSESRSFTQKENKSATPIKRRY